jgi:hypothetical protein
VKECTHKYKGPPPVLRLLSYVLCQRGQAVLPAAGMQSAEARLDALLLGEEGGRGDIERANYGDPDDERGDLRRRQCLGWAQEFTRRGRYVVASWATWISAWVSARTRRRRFRFGRAANG